MEFCSKYGYNYGFEGSDSDEYFDQEETLTENSKKRVRKADTNIIAFKFDEIVTSNKMFAGEPKPCNHCGACMSYLSDRNVVKEKQSIIWKCEFCEKSNEMTNIVDDMNEIPKNDDVTFLLETPKVKNELDKAEASIEPSKDDSIFSFCIDVSASMSEEIGPNGFTRLNGVQSACVDTLKKLKNEEPNRLVILVTFASTVKYFGDCTDNRDINPTVVINKNNDLNNKEIISGLAHNVSEIIKPIKETYQFIKKKILQLQPEDGTALGPALWFSVELASNKPGSTVILCTDGYANTGLGDVERLNPEVFYRETALKANEKGVVVNIVTIVNTKCRLAILRDVVDLTNGQMSIVNPLNLTDEFKSIIDNRIVAIKVVAKLIVSHRYLYIRDDELETEEGYLIEKGDQRAKAKLDETKKSVETRKIGNCSIDTEITFEYGIRKLKNEKKENLKKLPFQLQITFVGLDGTKAIRVFTKELEFTSDRKTAESSITSAGIALTHHAQMMSKQYLDSNVFQSKCRNQAAKNFFNRSKIETPKEYDTFSYEVQRASKDLFRSEETDYDTVNGFRFLKISRNKLARLNQSSINGILGLDDNKTINYETVNQTFCQKNESKKKKVKKIQTDQKLNPIKKHIKNA